MQAHNNRPTLPIIFLAILVALLAFLWWAGGGSIAGTLGSILAEQPKYVIRPDEVPECGPAWRIFPATNPSKEYDELRSIAVVSADDMWAAGTYGTEQYALTLTEHWDGKQWTHIDSPSVISYSNHLYGVATFASNDVWAVGASHQGTELWHTLTMHWDGSRWSIVPSPNLAPITIINGVAALSPNDVWAVGEYSRGRGGDGSHPMALHWDGKQWDVVTVPNTSGQDSRLNSVRALSASDIWAVGTSGDKQGTQTQPLIMHWDGRAWNTSETRGAGELFGVSAAAPTDIWAVGNNGPQTLIMHWNGSDWRAIASPNPGSRSNSLSGVTASSSGEVWAVGAQNNEGADQTLVMRWDGSRWESAPSPSMADFLDTLNAVIAVGQQDVWAVGSYIADPVGTNLNIIERYSDPCR